MKVAVDGAVVAGSVWMPDRVPRAVVLMIPGSGPSNRSCDGYFVLIRERFLDAGYAVAGFDKRGAGASTGSFADTDINTQAADALRCLDALAVERPNLPLGIFGHSQGGWVAFEVGARRSDLAFVISNSGPAVGPARQEHSRLVQSVDPSRRQAAGAAFDSVVAAARRHASVDEVTGLLASVPEFAERLGEYIAGGNAEWELETSFMRYEPTAAIGKITVPALVVHGQQDAMIPVQTSLDEFERIANPCVQTLLFPGASHRLLDDTDELVSGYLDALTNFMAATG